MIARLGGRRRSLSTYDASTSHTKLDVLSTNERVRSSTSDSPSDDRNFGWFARYDPHPGRLAPPEGRRAQAAIGPYSNRAALCEHIDCAYECADRHTLPRPSAPTGAIESAWPTNIDVSRSCSRHAAHGVAEHLTIMTVNAPATPVVTPIGIQPGPVTRLRLDRSAGSNPAAVPGHCGRSKPTKPTYRFRGARSQHGGPARPHRCGTGRDPPWIPVRTGILKLGQRPAFPRGNTGRSGIWTGQRGRGRQTTRAVDTWLVGTRSRRGNGPLTVASSSATRR